MSIPYMPPAPAAVPTYLQQSLLYWFAEPHETRCWFADDTAELGVRETVLPDSVFAAIHPDLPTAMRYQCLYHQRMSNLQSLPQTLLWAQVHQLIEPYSVQTTLDTTRWLKDVLTVTWMPPEPEVLLYATVLNVTNTLPHVIAETVYPELRTEVPFVANVEARHSRLTEDEMDRKFPDWRHRYAIADSLNLSTAEHARFVCPLPSSTQPLSVASPPLLVPTDIL